MDKSYQWINNFESCEILLLLNTNIQGALSNIWIKKKRFDHSIRPSPKTHLLLVGSKVLSCNARDKRVLNLSTQDGYNQINYR